MPRLKLAQLLAELHRCEDACRVRGTVYWDCLTKLVPQLGEGAGVCLPAAKEDLQRSLQRKEVQLAGLNGWSSKMGGG